MKKQLLSFCTISIMLFFSVVISAQYVAPYATMDIPAAQAYIVIDGVADASYGAVETTSIFKINGVADDGTPPCTTCTENNTGDANFELTFQACWDTTYLYLLCIVQDDVRHVIDTVMDNEPWMFDNIEIFVDLDTMAVAAYTANITSQLRFSRGMDDPSDPGYANKSDFEYIEVEVAAGYALEVAIPWTAIGGADVDILAIIDSTEVIGFDVSGADSDGDDGAVGERNTNGRQACWDWDGGAGVEDDAYADRRLFGFAKLTDGTVYIPPASAQYVAPYATMDIPAAQASIVIDGIADASYGAVETTSIFMINDKHDTSTSPCTTCTENNTGDANFELTFQACWDTTYLYLYCEVKDDLFHIPDTANITGTVEYWMFDNIEVFIDFDIAAIATYSIDTTIQLRFNKGFDSPTNPGNADASDFESFELEVPGAYHLEVAIPWTAVGADADILAVIDATEVIGFDVSGADSDGDDGTVGVYKTNGRQAAWDWDGGGGIEDGAHADRRLFGFAYLIGDPANILPTIPPDAITNITTTSFSVYPNPATGTITISDIIGSAAVYTVTGAKVMDINNLNGNTTVNVSSLANGVYFITAIETDGTVSVAKFVIIR